MSNSGYEKFDNLFSFLPKSKIKAGEGREEGKYKFFTSSAIQSKYLDEYNYDSESLIFGTGGKASIHYCNEFFATSTDCLVVEKKDSRIDVFYVYYYLRSNIQILENGFKGAGLKHISKKYISNIKIPILDLEEQRKIARHLSQIEKLVEKRKQSIDLLNEFVKSTFLDKFTFNDSKDKWKIEKIEYLALKKKGSMRTGPFGSDLLHSEFTESGDVAVLGIDNAVQNRFAWDKKRYISFEKYEKLKRYTIYPNDLIITIMGTIGRTAIVPDDIPLSINTKHLAAISLNQEVINPEFLAYSLREDPKILMQLKRKAKGAIMDGLNLTIIKNIKIELPPKDLQDKFADIVTKIEKTKQTYQNSLDELKELFGSVSQKAFKGELDLSVFELSKSQFKESVIVNNIDDKEKKLSQDNTVQLIEDFRQKSHELLKNGDIVPVDFIMEEEDDIIEEMLKKEKNSLEIPEVENNTITFDTKFLFMIIEQAQQITSSMIMKEISEYNFETKPSFVKIKDSLVDLLKNKKIEQFNYGYKTSQGFSEIIAFRVKE